MFVYHFDLQNDQWNVFKIVNGREEYVCSFHELEEADQFCESAMRAEVVNASSN